MEDDEYIPMFKRKRSYVIKPPLHVTERDMSLRDAVLNMEPEHDLFERPFRLMDSIDIPSIAFIGSSHVFRMNDVISSKHVPERVKYFLSKSKFVGVGGLKFWTSGEELNGIFDNAEKEKKYGKYQVEDRSAGDDYETLPYRPCGKRTIHFTRR